MELIKQIKEAENQAREIIEQAKQNASELSDQTRETTTEMHRRARQRRQQIIDDAIIAAEQEGAAQVDALTKKRR